MQDATQIIGRRVLNRGDVCNSPRKGTVTAIRSDRWGTFAVISYDDAETVGWERDGAPVEFTAATSEVSLHSITDETAPLGYSRFVFLAA